MCAALTFNLCLSAGYVGLWLMLAAQGEFWRADFTGYYTGWLMVADGQGPRLYDVLLQTVYQQATLAGRSFVDGVLPFNYPPYTALPFVPVTLLPLGPAFWAWTAGELALLGVLLRTLWRYTAAWSTSERAILVSGVLAFPPLLWTLQQGAFSLFITLCVLQWYLALKQGHDGRAGAWLAGGLIKPQLIVLPVLMLLVGRRWRAVLVLGAIAALLVLPSLLVLGIPAWIDYLGMVRRMSNLFGAFGINPGDMLNVRGLLAALLGSAHAATINLVTAVVLVGAIVVTAALWRGPWRPQESEFDLRVALTIALGLVTSPYLYPHDALVLIVPVTLAYGYLRAHNLPRRVFAVCVLANPVVFLVSELGLRGVLPVRLGFVAIVVLTVWLAHALRGAERVSAATAP
ncbi:MAG TPA: glycosyltransferase family 87 protein [Chloroflexota bacterium]